MYNIHCAVIRLLKSVYKKEKKSEMSDTAERKLQRIQCSAEGSCFSADYSIQKVWSALTFWREAIKLGSLLSNNV